MVVVGRLKFFHLPGSFFNVFGGINVGRSGSTRKSGNIERIVDVANAACPGTTSVGVFSIIQVQCIDIVKRIVAITHHLPVHQVFGFHDGHSRTHVHSSTAHVVGVANPYDGHVRHVSKYDWIFGFLSRR